MKVSTRPVVDRLTTPTRRKKYTGEGLCLGAEVTLATEIGRMTGQVWAQAPDKDCWWVIAVGHTWLMHESDLTVTGHAHNDNDLTVAA